MERLKDLFKLKKGVKNMNFKESIKEVKKDGIVLNVRDNEEPVILKHDKGVFKEISEEELLNTFNNNYNGANEIDVGIIKKELTNVEINDYKKRSWYYGAWRSF